MLYVNGRFLTQPITGVNRYAYDQCRKMQQDGIPFVLVCPRGSISNDYDLSGMQVVRFGWGRSHFWAQLVLPWFFLGKHDARLICFMGLAPLLVKHTEMTIHDLSFLYNPVWFSKGYYCFYRMFTPICARHAERLITVSKTSKDDVLTRYPFLKNKPFDIIRPNINTDFFYPSDVERQNFLLAVASLDPRKNMRTLIRVVSKHPSIRLKVVGGTNRVFADANVSPAANVEMLGRVSDSELRQLYRTAAGFVFPSLFEGYGSPPVEAMLCDCPVAVSDIPVLHETCDLMRKSNSTILYFNPLDENDILDKIEQLLKSHQHNQ